MLNKKAIFFSMLSILFVILLVSFVLSFSKYHSSSLNKDAFYLKESNLLSLNESIFLSLEDYYGFDYSGIMSLNNSYYYLCSFLVQNSSSLDYSNEINDFLYDNYALNYSTNWTYFFVNDIKVDNLNSFETIFSPEQSFDSINLSVYIDANSSSISVIEPSSDSEGIALNIWVYNSSNELFSSYNYVLLSNESNSFIVNYNSESFNLTYSNSNLSLKKSSSNKEVLIKNLKLIYKK